jgi:hypothetical protein
MLIHCCTLFDITETGITGHFKSSQIPFTDRAGQQIANHAGWNRARNQQRNLETISQVLQLRTQIFDVTIPTTNNGRWCFDFTVEAEGIYQQDQDLFGILKNDCNGVPMIIGLNDQYVLTPFLITDGVQQNIWFDPVVVNN